MLATTIANHYASAGDQPAALKATVRAVRAAECVQAFGEAAHLSSARSSCGRACPTPSSWSGSIRSSC